MPCDELSRIVEIVNTRKIGDGKCRRDIGRIVVEENTRLHNFHYFRSNLRITKIKENRNVVMAPHPVNRTTKNLSASCSSSSCSSSNGSSFDRPRPNESTNSSSSLILVLERPENKDNEESTYKQIGSINFDEKAINSTVNDDTTNERNFHNFNNDEASLLCPRFAPSRGFPGKVTNSSIENLAKRKGQSTGRCRRKRSTASPRTKRNSSIVINDETSNNFETTRSSNAQDSTGFVATSTLTKNRDCSALLTITANSSRCAGKLRLESSSCTSDITLVRNHDDVVEGDNSNREIRNMTSHATIKTQQSTIAAIRGTNVPFESRNNNNSTINYSPKVRCNVPYASAPSLNNNNNQYNHKHRGACRETTLSHSTTSRSSSAVQLPVASLSSHNPPGSLGARAIASKSKKNTKCFSSPATSESMIRASPVKSCSPGYARYSPRPLPTEKSPTNSAATTNITLFDSAISLKSSSSFTSAKVVRKNRQSRVINSLHASLGQLPINTSSCCNAATRTISATTATPGEATSLENLENFAPTRNEKNADRNFSPITLYSTNGSPIPKVLSLQQSRNSNERIFLTNGGSTSSSSFTNNKATSLKIVELPEIGNSPNTVASAFRNSLVTSGNVNNNNGRCNHLSGTCACSAGTTTASQTSSTLTRIPNIVNGVATSSSSWTNNSVEQETDYVVDPVQGNAYHKGQFLGKGGFARVYLMTDVANGNRYACKIIPKNRMQKIHIQKIAREIMIHKELNHVNVVQMHHYFEDNINVYMLLEPCPRKSLMHVLKYRGKVTEPEARYYMRQMVTGVAYIHSQKVVHRDLKPGNMFLSDGMIVKIGDFGLATRPDGQRRRVTICGTPNYIAPEVLYKQAYSYEADVWALGCILYALLAGQPPFDTSTLKETYARICNNRYKKLDDSVITRSGQDLIRWLLQPIPELRPSLERVKEHAYLTVEYVPSKLSHTCCYRIPSLQTITNEQTSSTIGQQIAIGNSIVTRGIMPIDNAERNKRDNGDAGAVMPKNLHQTVNYTTSRGQLENGRIVEITKKPKVGNWLFRKLPKLPRFRQRLTRLLCPEHKKPDSLMMHRAIESCLAEIRCTRTLENPVIVDRIAPLFVTKWIDYSNKYGLGFQLSDRSVGVLFNDSTKMSYTHDRRRVEYATTDDEVTRYRRESDVPSCMEEKLELLRHFTHYMDNFLTNGGEIREHRTTKFTRTSSASSVPRMRRWLRTDKAIVMELTVPLLQVNFFVDHSKIVVSEGTRGRGYLVTYIDASRQASSYWLSDLREVGCTAELYERLHYVSKVIAELENDAIFETTLGQNRKTLRA